MRVLIDKGIGYVPTPQPIQLVDEKGQALRGDASGKLTVEASQYLYGLLLGLSRAVNGNLSIGDGSPGSRSGNVFGQWVPVLTPSVANTEFAVDHALGRIPAAVIIGLQDKLCGICVSSQGSWTEDRIYLRCSTGSATLRLWLL